MCVCLSVCLYLIQLYYHSIYLGTYLPNFGILCVMMMEISLGNLRRHE